MKTTLSYLVVLTMSSLSLIACDVSLKRGSFQKDRAASISATERLHVFYNEERFDNFYDLGSPDFQKNFTREQFKASMANVRSTTGRHLTSKLVGSSCFPGEVRLLYHSSFGSGPFTEIVIWSLPGDKALLSMYSLEPDHVPLDKQAQKWCPT
jgi:hypothetical protein